MPARSRRCRYSGTPKPRAGDERRQHDRKRVRHVRSLARHDHGVSSTPVAPFVHAVRFRGLAEDYTDELPALRDVERIELHPRVTFFVGENGSGKSTLVEALAVALKLNPEGGSRIQQFAFSTRSSHSRLHRRVHVERAPLPPRNAFFLRAE